MALNVWQPSLLPERKWHSWETTTSLSRTYVSVPKFKSPLMGNLMKSLTEPPTGYMKRNSDSTKPSSGPPTDLPSRSSNLTNQPWRLTTWICSEDNIRHTNKMPFIPQTIPINTRKPGKPIPSWASTFTTLKIVSPPQWILVKRQIFIYPVSNGQKIRKD